MKIEKIINPVAQENTYLLSNSTSIIVIDPGNQANLIIQKVKSYNLPLSAILLTHAHFDHIMGLELLKSSFPDTPIYLHYLEKDWPKNPELNASLLLTGISITAPEADLYYHFDEFYSIDDFKFKVLQTPGHSIGGVSLYFPLDYLVFSGDALFKNSIGRTDLPTGNHKQLIDSIKTVLFNLPMDTKVFPGHGPETTLSSEKTFNPFL